MRWICFFRSSSKYWSVGKPVVHQGGGRGIQKDLLSAMGRSSLQYINAKNNSSLQYLNIKMQNKPKMQDDLIFLE